MNSFCFQFEKYHGTGNDFLLVHENQLIDSELNSEIIRHLCDRHFGIGADGLIIIRTSQTHDFEMQYYNSDGNEGTMCGNGGRCAVAYAFTHHLITNGRSAVFSAIDGIHHAEVKDVKENQIVIELEMANCQLPMPAFENTLFINTGSPHIVRQVDDVLNFDVYPEGKRMRNHFSLQPGGSNINFFSPHQSGISVRTYERGVENETLSCGTGVTASAICFAHIQHLSGNQTIHTETPGGTLIVRFTITDEDVRDIHLLGLAVKVFDGQMLI